MKTTNTTIHKLLEKYKEISMLNRISALLNWDLNVNLPPKSASDRAAQIAYLTEKITDLWLDPSFRSLLEKANNEKNLSAEEQAIIRNLNRGGHFYYNVPKEVIVRREHITAMAFPVWAKAREENDFNKFLPELRKIVEISREIADYLTFKENPYDALLDLYEPELTAKECGRLFAGVKKELIILLNKIKKSETYSATVASMEGKTYYPKAEQEKILHYAITSMGFDLNRGRVDISPHPFTIELAEHDIRLTTHYREFDFRESLTSAIHEAGHGLYEQGINSDYTDTPIGNGVSLGIHEALSRFWENMVGKNPVFIKSMLPILKTVYNSQLSGIDEMDIIRAFNLVKPSFIRIEADEVTYTLHIILRFEMENALINGDIAVDEANEAWKEKSKELFGIAPKTDKEGVLQDVHWTFGSIGYFPSYALGNLYGAQFLHEMKKTVAFDTEVENGNLRPIKDWLDKNIHTHGSHYLPKELIKNVTGETLNYTYFIEYLKEKYTTLYGLT